MKISIDPDIGHINRLIIEINEAESLYEAYGASTALIKYLSEIIGFTPPKMASINMLQAPTNSTRQ